MKKKRVMDISNELVPAPVKVTIQHVDSSTTVYEHIDADAKIMTSNLAMMMSLFPSLESLSDMCQLSSHLMKLLKERRQLCLKPTCIAETEGDEINITPVK